jgi:hypothetical protein
MGINPCVFSTRFWSFSRSLFILREKIACVNDPTCAELSQEKPFTKKILLALDYTQWGYAINEKQAFHRLQEKYEHRKL